MTDASATLDQELWKFISAKDEEAVYDFCAELTPKYPVCIDLKHCIEGMVDYLGYAMILYSGYQSDKFGPLAAAAKQMVKQEIESGRWNELPEDEKDAAGVIASRCYDDLSKSQAAVEEPEKVYMVIGLYTYTRLICADKTDVWDFIKLFVNSWLIYYSEILSIPAASKSEGPQRAS